MPNFKKSLSTQCESWRFFFQLNSSMLGKVVENEQCKSDTTWFHVLDWIVDKAGKPET